MRSYTGPKDTDRALAIAVDQDGQIYVTGQSQGSDGFFDYATVKYSSSGAQLWVERYDLPGSGDHVAVDVAVDASGNVYVTGYSQGGPTSYDYATIKYKQGTIGDVNADEVIDLGDAVYLLNYLFKGGPAPSPALAIGDVNCDEAVDVGDAIYLLNYLFKGGLAPCAS